MEQGTLASGAYRRDPHRRDAPAASRSSASTSTDSSKSWSTSTCRHGSRTGRGAVARSGARVGPTRADVRVRRHDRHEGQRERLGLGRRRPKAAAKPGPRLLSRHREAAGSTQTWLPQLVPFDIFLRGTPTVVDRGSLADRLHVAGDLLDLNFMQLQRRTRARSKSWIKVFGDPMRMGLRIGVLSGSRRKGTHDGHRPRPVPRSSTRNLRR